MTSGPPIVEAVVQVGAETTPYLRCGRGERAVLVVAGAADRLRLVRLLHSGQRIFAPEPPADLLAGPNPAGAFARWVRGVADGLGLERPLLLLGPEYGTGAPGPDCDWEDEWCAVLVLAGQDPAPPAALTAPS